jgi:diacylglycerol kinase (ATP)
MSETPPTRKHGRRQRILRATLASIKGLRYVYAHETAFRQELMLAGYSILTCLFFLNDLFAFLAVISSWLLVLIVEVINSAVEAIVDRVSLETHPLSGAAKDLGSLAVALALINACGWWAYAIFH